MISYDIDYKFSTYLNDKFHFNLKLKNYTNQSKYTKSQLRSLIYKFYHNLHYYKFTLYIIETKTPIKESRV